MLVGTRIKACFDATSLILLIGVYDEGSIKIARSENMGATFTDVTTPAATDADDRDFGLTVAPDQYSRFCLVYYNTSAELITKWSADNGETWLVPT